MRLWGITASIATVWPYFPRQIPSRKSKTGPARDPTIKIQEAQPAFNRF